MVSIDAVDEESTLFRLFLIEAISSEQPINTSFPLPSPATTELISGLDAWICWETSLLRRSYFPCPSLGFPSARHSHTVVTTFSLYTMGVSWPLLAALAAGAVSAIDVDITSAASIKDASSTIAYDMLTSYTGNNTGDNPGNLPPPYYWWEAGAMFMHMVDYYYCKNHTFLLSPILAAIQ